MNIELKEGANTITVMASDTAGNQTSASLIVNYTPPDTISPIVSITSPTDDGTFETTDAFINLTGLASDNVSIKEVIWSSSSGKGGTANGTYNWSVYELELIEGQNTITIKAIDTAGNESSQTLLVVDKPEAKDQTPPSVTIRSTGDRAYYFTRRSSADLSGTASDDTGVTKVTWVNSKGGEGTATGTLIWFITDLELSPGWNKITVTAVDEAGNVSSDSVSINYRTRRAPRIPRRILIR